MGTRRTSDDDDPVGARAETTSQDATFTFSADQAGSTFLCSIDGGDFLPCTSPVTYEGFADGEHSLSVEATNTYGLIEVDPVEYTWTVAGGVDTTAPNTTIDTAPAAVVLLGEAVFTFSSNEVGVTFECALDSPAFAACTSPHEVSGLLDGEHTFVVRAVDAAGNVDASPASLTWTVDLPPVVEILSGPDEVTESTTATFTFGLVSERVDR